jgi:hypothetical protein
MQLEKCKDIKASNRQGVLAVEAPVIILIITTLFNIG